MKGICSRLLLLLLALVMALGLAACGGTAEPAPEQEDAYTEEVSGQETETADPTQDQTDSEDDKAPSSDPAEEVLPEEETASQETEDGQPALDEEGQYTTKEDVALYIHLYGHLPDNFLTKKEAQALGWQGGSLEPYAPGCSIGGSRFGNYEGTLPDKEGRTWTECDIDTMGAKSRGAKRIVFSNDGLIYYTDDHYKTFTLLYGEE